MSGIIDFHSHILPGVDDGSTSVEMSVAMLQMEAQQNIRHVIATPHFYGQHDTVNHFLEKRAEAEQRLREAMIQADNMPRLSVGAEVYFFRGISEADQLNELTIDGKQCILIEMPHTLWTDAMYQELEAIYTRQGLIPIIAHVERYLGRFRTFGIPEKLAELPVLVQSNASFFCNSRTSAQAMRLLKTNRIQLLGSDCHNTHSRLPNLGAAVDAIRKKTGEEILERIRAAQESLLI